MKRPCFALTLLLASLAGSLLATGSARCQSGLDPAPDAAWHGEACPLATRCQCAQPRQAEATGRAFCAILHKVCETGGRPIC